MKHVLLIANIDINSEDLMAYAASFCAKYMCKLHILKITPKQQPILFTSAYYLDQRALTDYYQSDNDKNKEVLDTVAKHASGLINMDWVSVNFRAGNADAVIEKFITDNFIDLVIVSKKLFLNSSSFDNQIRNVLSNIISLPMLLIPGYQTFKPLKKTDFLTTHSKDDIDHIEWLNENFIDLKISVTHIINEKQKPKVPKEKWLGFLQSKINKKVDYQTIDNSLVSYLKAENLMIIPRYDSFAFTTHNRNVWQRLWDPSTALNLAAKSDYPTFVFKYKNE